MPFTSAASNFSCPQKAIIQLTQSFTFWIFKAFIMEWWVQKNRNPNWIHYFRVVLGAWFETERVCVQTNFFWRNKSSCFVQPPCNQNSPHGLKFVFPLITQIVVIKGMYQYNFIVSKQQQHLFFFEQWGVIKNDEKKTVLVSIA